eukprot:1000792_1
MPHDLTECKDRIVYKYAGNALYLHIYNNILLTNSKRTRRSYDISIISFISPMVNDILFCTTSQFSCGAICACFVFLRLSIIIYTFTVLTFSKYGSFIPCLSTYLHVSGAVVYEH